MRPVSHTCYKSPPTQSLNGAGVAGWRAQDEWEEGGGEGGGSGDLTGLFLGHTFLSAAESLESGVETERGKLVSFVHIQA